MRQVAAVLTVLAACAGTPEGASPARQGPVRIGGDPTLTTRLLPALVETWVNTRPDARIEVLPRSTSEAFEDLVMGKLDMAASSRDASPSEEEQAKALRLTLDTPETRHIVAVDVVAVAVHPHNVTESLTYDQVIGIFCTRSIDNWSFLGLEPRPIHVLAREPESGTQALFEDFFCGPRGLHPSLKAATSGEVSTALADDPDVITLVSLSEGVGKALALRVDPTAPSIRPSQDNIIRGVYPLYGDRYLFTRGVPAGDLAAFLAWIKSPAGQEVVDEQRFVPLFLRPERLDEPRPLRETVHFEGGSSDPNQRSLARLQLLVQELRERQIRHVVLEGYTDDREADPFGLSAQRAEAVRGLLAKAMPELYFEIIPRGPKSPIAPNDTPYGRQVNRRVQIYLAEEEQETPSGRGP
jgi:phosphate transport system substrate-binding protein